MLKSEEALRLIKLIADFAGASFEEKKTGGQTELRIGIKPSTPSAIQPHEIALKYLDENQKLSVLHVEDASRAGDLIHYYLRNKFEVTSAENAEEALKYAFEKPFDFILMDMNLGSSMSGFELTKLLRKTERYAQTPIVAITGYTRKADVERCMEAGCSAYLAKPFLKEDLLRVLAELARLVSNVNP